MARLGWRGSVILRVARAEGKVSAAARPVTDLGVTAFVGGGFLF